MQNLFKFAFIAIAFMLFSFGSVEASGLPEGGEKYQNNKLSQDCITIVTTCGITVTICGDFDDDDTWTIVGNSGSYEHLCNDLGGSGNGGDNSDDNIGTGN
ncbi:MAG: hypothetical protein JJT94_06390 [Bernardetiaceae bacterium]|nr:hypothetical protein [Bernardetiaceae bacterium]